MRTSLVLGSAALALSLAASATACGDDAGTGAGSADVVVTTNVLGDIVRHLVGDDATVEVLMPVGTDPHEFAASPKQAEDLRSAHVVVENGLHFEQGLDDAIAAAKDDGAVVEVLADHVPHLLTREEDGKPAPDPHVFNDPARMAVAVAALGDELADEVPGLDTPAYRGRVAAYVTQLRALDAQIEQLLAAVPASRRVLVTNHEALGYLADRYRFRVLGAVVPSLSTLGEASAADLARLADHIRAAGVPAIFAETTSPTRLADALASEVGTKVRVVRLFVESLGPKGSGATTYVDMQRTNARRIAGALSG